LEANLADRESMFLLLRAAKIFTPVVHKRQEVNFACTQLEYDLTLTIASGAAIFKKSQVWLEQVWIFFVCDDLVVVASDLDSLIVVAVLTVVPADRVLALVGEGLTGGSGQKSEEFELWVGYVVVHSEALGVLTEPVTNFAVLPSTWLDSRFGWFDTCDTLLL